MIYKCVLKTSGFVFFAAYGKHFETEITIGSDWHFIALQNGETYPNVILKSTKGTMVIEVSKENLRECFNLI